MSNVQLDPYIFFAGNCKEAMNFYKEVFGGELYMQMYDEMPADAGDLPENSANKVMYSSLTGGMVKIMASDSTTHDSWEQSLISLSLSSTDEELLRTVFDKLSEDGKVDQPLKKEFWGAWFGGVTDKFGIEWMVNIELPEGEENKEGTEA